MYTLKASWTQVLSIPGIPCRDQLKSGFPLKSIKDSTKYHLSMASKLYDYPVYPLKVVLNQPRGRGKLVGLKRVDN